MDIKKKKTGPFHEFFEKYRNIFAGFINTVLFIIVVLELILIMSYISNPSMPPNIVGFAPYIIGTNDMSPDLKKGDLLVARIPDREPEMDEIVCYMESKEIRIGKVTNIVEDNYYVVNKEFGEYIDSSQAIGLYKFKIEGLGKVILAFNTIQCRFVMVLMIFGYIIYSDRAYYKYKIKTILKKKKK